MPVIESPPPAERQQASGTSAVPGRALRILRNFLAGLDKLLQLSDFGRGDWFRD